MDILTPHDGVTNDKIAKAQIEAVERKQNEYKLIGQLVRVPGHTLYKFIEYILTRNEWGNIRFIGGSSYGYRQNQLLYPIPDRYMETRIASVKAAGGWSNMDYLIEMEK